MNSDKTATLTLAERIKAILTARNKEWAEADLQEQVDDPVADFEPTPAATVADVVKCLSASGIQDAYGLHNRYQDDSMKMIVDEIMEEIAGADYKPWPELTRDELRFLIGERKNSAQCPFPLFAAITYAVSEPLTFAERVTADRNRAWLEKDVEAKRKRLVKAQAEVAKLSGKAA